MTEELPCPVCGFETVEGNYGNFIICGVCSWEDDGVQLANPCSKGGANGCSLAEAQEELLNEYPLSVKEVDGHKRSNRWRPLNQSEIETANLQLKSEVWPNMGILYERDAYWCKDS